MNVQKAIPLTELREGTRSTAAKAASTDERLLVAQAKSGRSSAFGKLYELHRVSITLPSGYFAIDKMRKMQFNVRFNALSQTSTDFAKTRPFPHG